MGLQFLPSPPPSHRCLRDRRLTLTQVPPVFQALPYVALLIAMLFFIYAVIGMQVRARGPLGGRPAGWTLTQPAPCIPAAPGLATAPGEEVVPSRPSVSQEEAAQGNLVSRWTRAELLSTAPAGGSGGLSYPLLEHPALYMETLSQLLVRNTVPLTRFIWLEEKTFTQPWKHK